MIMLLLTGPTAAGKNTIATPLAQRFARCAVVDFDLVRAMFVHPHRAPWQGGEGHHQQILGIALVCQLARGFAQAGWNVIILDVVTEALVQHYTEALHAFPLTIVQILPTFEENLRRFVARGPCLTDQEFEQTYHDQVAFAHYHARIDNTNLTPEDVADRLMPLMP
jgi:chloramphenicol 3-O-phosphotransferase